MKWFLVLLVGSSLFASPHEKYFGLLENYPKTLGVLGNHEKGEIEIVSNLQDLDEIERIAQERLLKRECHLR